MYTQRLAKYIKEKGISIAKIANETGIPYSALYDSLASTSRNRELRIDEFAKICRFIEKDIEDFVEVKKPTA